ncbi:MAG: histidine ammonia-lyase [Chloroflexota bacterium]|nr:histidine ammonia-lyase [Chloroflexota bacterium]
MNDKIVLNGERLTIKDVIAIAGGCPVGLAPKVLPRIRRSREGVEQLLARGEVAYGITTGFGAFKDRIIPLEQVAELQHNLVRSHAAGVGKPLDEQATRATLAIRANTLTRGYSGVRIEVIEALLALLNRRVHPIIPSIGSLGASGDLAPLAHLALVLIGEGEAIYEGQWLDGADALRQAGLEPLELQAKEGLALVNGTAMTTALGALAVQQAENLVRAGDIAGALSLEALHGTPMAFDERLHVVRPHPRQVDCAAYLRRLLENSTFVRPHDPRNIQDAYTLRCMPQVHGAVHDTVAYARWAVEIELNSVTDNPLIFFDETSAPEVISGGNFHAEPLALALDYMAIGITELGNISERRTARLVDAAANGGMLPAFLTHHGGLESGFMISQYTAAALASENKVLSHPVSIDSIPTSANTEDHVSMSATAARQATWVLGNTERIIAIELFSGAQGINFRREVLGPGARLGRGTRAAYDLIRRHVPFIEHDEPPAPHIEAVTELVRSGELVQAVDAALEV